MTENQRLKKIREILGIDQKQFALALDMQQGSLSDVERGRTGVSQKVAKKLDDLGVNMNYILNGAGNQLHQSVENVQLNFKNAIYKNINIVSEPKTDYNARPSFNLDNNNENLYVIPIKAFGGFLAGYSNKAYMDSLEKVAFPFVRGKCYAFEIEGYSMVPEDPKEDAYPPGSWVVCTEVEDLSWCQKGKVYVFATIDGICIKQFLKIDGSHIYLNSINPSKEYKVQPIPLKSVKKAFHVDLKMAKPFY